MDDLKTDFCFNGSGICLGRAEIELGAKSAKRAALEGSSKNIMSKISSGDSVNHLG